MKQLIFITGSLLLLQLLNSCSPGNKVRLEDSNLGDTVEVLQNLVFKFSHELVPDSAIGKWDSSAYLSFRPEVKGLYKWTAKDQLVFSPAAGFKPATKYNVSFSTSLLKYSRGLFSLDASEIIFQTGVLQITGMQTWWTLSPVKGDALRLNTSISFNYEVDAASIGKLITARLNGKPIDLVTGEPSVSNTIVMYCDGILGAEAHNGDFRIEIHSGLRCTECTEEAPFLSYGLVLAPISSLEFTRIETEFENGEGVIRISTNQPVQTTDLKKLITISPSPAYSVETTESGLVLRGAFSAGSSYNLTINSSIQGLLGGRLQNDYYQNISFGEQEPGITFVNSKGVYLTSKSSRKVALQIVNMQKIKISVYKIYENNILAFMNNNRYEDWQADENGTRYVYTDYDPERYGNKIMDQQYEVKDLPLQNGQRLLSLDFDDGTPFKGIYLISAASTENQWMKATKIVSISDIGLIAKTGRNEVMIFANSIKDATSLSNIRVNIISSNNQVLFSGKTNLDGMVHFQGLKDRFMEFKPALITAGGEGDYNYMLLSDSRVETSRFETGGYRDHENGYMAFLYGDRDIYRPGDILHFNAIVRNQLRKPLSRMPVKFKLLLPNGRELSLQGKTLNDEGAATYDFTLPTGTATGTYILELYTANDILLSNKTVSVEEFMPDRISVKVSTNKSIYLPGDSLQLDGLASNLFGTAASGRNYEVQFNLNKIAFQPKGYPAYNFSIKGLEQVSFPGVFKQGKTASDGRINENFLIQSNCKETGILEGKAFLTVFDETGRPVNRVSSFEVQTQMIFLGTRTSEYYAGIGQPLQMGVIALNNQGKPAISAARIQLVKINYHNILKRDYNDRIYYVSQKEEKIIQDKQVTIGKKELIVPFTPNESGEYAFRVRLPGSDRYTEQQFYAYGWGFTGSNSFAVNTEGTIDISTDKEQYAPGEKARCLFKTPFNGRLLVTVEQNEVKKYYYLNTDKKAAELVLAVEKEYLPNIYITATLFRKSDDGSLPLTVAHGIIPVAVEEKSNRLNLSIHAATQSRSNTQQQITVNTTPGKEVELSIAVVDEGILQLHNTKTPDPYGYFYQKKALMTESYDIYPYLLPDLKIRRSSTGGDGYDLAKRLNPVTNKRVRLVSAWSGILKTNAAGVASYTVDIPSFSGDLRVMAVAYQGSSFGHAEAHIKVADPIVISPALPRFTSPGDTVLVPVTFTNTTGQPITAGLQLETTGKIKLINTSVSGIKVNAGEEQRLLFKLTTGTSSGEGSFIVRIKNGAETYMDKTDITVRPATGLQKRDGNGSIKSGTEAEIDLQTGFIPSTTEAELLISKSPLVRFADQLKYLLDYPHGCAEQTISTAFPQIYFADLAKFISNKPGRTINTSENVQAGISKILSLQQYNGGIATWPGNNSTNNWTSVYAAHFLTEAKKAGYQVNENGFEKLLAFLQKNLKSKNTEELWYQDRSGQIISRKIPAKDLFYSMYVLALNNKADRSSMNYYKSGYKVLALDSRYLLACSYLAAGDRRTYLELLPKAFEGEMSQTSTGGSFYSYIRDLSMALNALLHTDPENPQVGVLVKKLSTEISRHTWMNTQERALSFLALGKFSRQSNASRLNATITTDGGKQFNFDGQDLLLRKDIANRKIKINVNGNGQLYYFWSSNGQRADGSYLQEDKNLKVRKNFFNRNGQEIKGNNFRQNDLIVVKITLENSSRSFIENVVITDLLPAGFEIENPRVSSIPDLDWIKNNQSPEYLDIRDDRINLYTAIGQQPQYFYYVVRAVSPGSFVMGPVSADAMYSGEYHSMNGAGRIIINQ